jgi:hypothetical protein
MVTFSVSQPPARFQATRTRLFLSLFVIVVLVFPCPAPVSIAMVIFIAVTVALAVVVFVMAMKMPLITARRRGTSGAREDCRSVACIAGRDGENGIASPGSRGLELHGHAAGLRTSQRGSGHTSIGGDAEVGGISTAEGGA